MNNYESGKYIAQRFSHDIVRLLSAIYDGSIEPQKGLNDFEKGVIDEVKTWHFHSAHTIQLLSKIEAEELV
jgi:hypothetical protein